MGNLAKVVSEKRLSLTKLLILLSLKLYEHINLTKKPNLVASSHPLC